MAASKVNLLLNRAAEHQIKIEDEVANDLLLLAAEHNTSESVNTCEILINFSQADPNAGRFRKDNNFPVSRFHFIIVLAIESFFQK